MQDTSTVLATMTALETAIAETQAAYQNETQTAKWASRNADEVEPTKWTRAIEAAIGKPEELESLRVQFDEHMLTFVSVLLVHSQARKRVFDCYSPLCDGIREIVSLLDDTELKKMLPRHLSAAMQALALRASETHRTPRTECSANAMDDLSDRSRAYKILVAAFSSLAGDLAKHASHPPTRYTVDLSVNGRAYKPFLNPDVDLRNIVFVPFVDCVNSTHPHNAQLSVAYAAVEKALTTARASVKKLKGEQNGQVNERQHAGRMLDLLHGEQSCSGNISQQVKAQNERRLAYETARLQTMLAIDELQTCYQELVAALYAAGSETADFLAEIQGQDIVTIDRKDTVRIAMNNCLAVDCYLRRVGRELLELTQKDSRDLSLGNGAAVLAASFEEVARHYRHSRSATSQAKD